MLSDVSDQFADGTEESASYWKGFKPRQGIVLEMHKLASGESR